MTLQNLFENMKSGEPYYTMVVYDPEFKQWYNEFGDYDKECVAYEMDDYIHGFMDVKPKHIKILKTADNPNSIQAAINKLNEAVK